jgi:hypothetical protein
MIKPAALPAAPAPMAAGEPGASRVGANLSHIGILGPTLPARSV